MAKKTTIYDLAKQCNVSPATVSRVLNQPSLVSAETRNKIYAAMQTLDYNIKNSDYIDYLQTNGGLIIVNLPHFSNPFYGEIVKGIEESAKRYNCGIMIFSENLTEKSLPRFRKLMKDLKPIGMITTTINDPKTILEVNSILPTVQCCECCEDVGVSSVSINDVAAANNAVSYLCSTGRKRIAFVNGPLDYKCDRDRLEGYKKALEAHSIEPIPSLITNLPVIDYSIAVSAVSQMLAQPNSITPDAIFASSDVFAIAAIRSAHLQNLKIPQDIAIIGFDNIDVSAISVPALTTINQPRMQLGFSSCDLLFDRILHPEYPIKHMILDAEMIIRESA